MMYARRLDSAELAKLLAPDQLEEQLQYDALQDSINEAYPRGHFVAVYDGRIIGDASGFDELVASIKARGIDPKKSVVMQAGRRVSNYVFIHGRSKT